MPMHASVDDCNTFHYIKHGESSQRMGTLNLSLNQS